MNRVALVDSGYGNIRSVERALETAAGRASVDCTIIRTGDPDIIRKADHVVFPGQGAFGDCGRAIAGPLSEVLREQMTRGTPFLGICVGLQLLFEGSEEDPGVPGLGWFKGQVVRLDPEGVKIPHMGWNHLELVGDQHPALEAAGGAGAWTYFVHSYHAAPAEPDILRAYVTYGKNRVTAAVGRDNVLATQFHPEKSQQAGLDLLSRFLTV